MDGLRAITVAHLPSAVRVAWSRSVDAIRQSPAANYLRGLTAARVGLVLLICAILTAATAEPVRLPDRLAACPTAGRLPGSRISLPGSSSLRYRCCSP